MAEITKEQQDYLDETNKLYAEQEEAYLEAELEKWRESKKYKESHAGETMKTELEFLEYIERELERQLISSGYMIYSDWIKQEISFRKSELKAMQEIK